MGCVMLIGLLCHHQKLITDYLPSRVQYVVQLHRYRFRLLSPH
jgi:hypothetical protein